MKRFFFIGFIFLALCLNVQGQEASDALEEMVQKVHDMCPRAFVPGVKLCDVVIDDDYVVCSFTADEGFAQRGTLNSERNKESLKLSLLKNFRRMNRESLLRKMAEEVAECDMGVKGVLSLDSGEQIDVSLSNDELREATGRVKASDE